jgi:hypothetical protein
MNKHKKQVFPLSIRPNFSVPPDHGMRNEQSRALQPLPDIKGGNWLGLLASLNLSRIAAMIQGSYHTK